MNELCTAPREGPAYPGSTPEVPVSASFPLRSCLLLFLGLMPTLAHAAPFTVTVVDPAPCNPAWTPITELQLEVDPDDPAIPGTALVTSRLAYSGGSADVFATVPAALTFTDDAPEVGYSSITSDVVHLMYAPDPSTAATEPLIDITLILSPTQFSGGAGDPFATIVTGNIKVSGALFGPGYNCLVEMDSVVTAIGTVDVSCGGDLDQDGVCDPDDVCADGDDGADLDADGTPDACDACPLDLYDDSDGDGSCDGDDACPDEDASGWDLDADGCLDDSDGDSVTDDVDVFPDCDDLDTDSDGDLTPDDCDVCPRDAENDADGDGLCAYDSDGSILDVCPYDNDSDGSDLDGDTVCNSDDVCSDLTASWLGGSQDDLLDFDEDGIADGCDLCVDSDADGVCTSEDTCFFSGHLGDADVDGVCDDADACPLDYLDDSDGDGSCDSDDVCPGSDDTLDGDADTSPDCLDRCPFDPENDADGDGLCESDDNCEGVANPDQADADQDGVGNACELDSDGDGHIDDADNCDFVSNPSQVDVDNDGLGDACDADDDNDTVADGRDRCPNTPANTPVLSNGCSAAQTCPTTARWKNHGDYVECVEDAAQDLYRARVITQRERQALITAAANSSVGRNQRDRDRDHRGHGHERDGGCRD